jgi:transglutaminase-like putative cysteine protease
MLTQALIAAARSSSLPARYVIGVFVGPDGVALVRRWAQVWDGARFLDLDAIQEDMTAGTSHVQLWTGHAPPDKQLTDAVTRVASDGVRPHTRP